MSSVQPLVWPQPINLTQEWRNCKHQIFWMHWLHQTQTNKQNNKNHPESFSLMTMVYSFFWIVRAAKHLFSPSILCHVLNLNLVLFVYVSGVPLPFDYVVCTSFYFWWILFKYDSLPSFLVFASAFFLSLALFIFMLKTSAESTLQFEYQILGGQFLCGKYETIHSNELLFGGKKICFRTFGHMTFSFIHSSHRKRASSVSTTKAKRDSRNETIEFRRLSRTRTIRELNHFSSGDTNHGAHRKTLQIHFY